MTIEVANKILRDNKPDMTGIELALLTVILHLQTRVAELTLGEKAQ